MNAKFIMVVVLALANLLTVVYYILTSDSLSISHSVTFRIVSNCCDVTPTIQAARDRFRYKMYSRKVGEGNVYTRNVVIKTKKKKETNLEADMKRCSLAVGMSMDELSELPSVAKKAQLFLDMLQSIWPQHFSRNFRNPCWYPNFTLSLSAERTLVENIRITRLLQKSQILQLINKIVIEFNSESHHLFCLPHFFLAGFPKSGTTSLHATLSKHPQVLAPNEKEPHWWTRIPLADMNPDYLKLVAMRYPLYFTSAATALNNNFKQGITYDGTQTLLWDSNFFSEISHIDYCATPAIVSRILPNAKFIVLMRNPVTREYSNFFYLCDRGQRVGLRKLQDDPPSHFHHEASTVINTLNICLQTGNHSLMWCLGQIKSLQEGCGYIGGRLAIGLYYVHLYKWFQFYPQENFLFLRTEDMHKDPHRMMTQITEFLGLDPVSEEDARLWLSKEANAQQIYHTAKYKMKPETKHLMESFYKPYNELLVHLIGDERFFWT